MTATLTLKSLADKSTVILLIAAAVNMALPHTALGASLQTSEKNSTIVFDAKQKEGLQKEFTGLSYQEVWENSNQYKVHIALKKFLEDKKSVLAPCSETIVQQKNWKMILALANAESSLGKNGKHYPVHLNNFWGVGGAKLWKMGENPCEAIVSMNEFLENYPKRGVKYANMSVQKMNGFYKQPAAPHWERNVFYILDALEKIEKEVKLQSPPVQVGML